MSFTELNLLKNTKCSQLNFTIEQFDRTSVVNLVKPRRLKQGYWCVYVFILTITKMEQSNISFTALHGTCRT